MNRKIHFPQGPRVELPADALHPALLGALGALLGDEKGVSLESLQANLAGMVARPSSQEALDSLLSTLTAVIAAASTHCFEADAAVHTARRGLRESAAGLAEINEQLYQQLVLTTRATQSLRSTADKLLREAGLSELEVEGGGDDIEALARLMSELVQDNVRARRALEQQKFALDQHSIVSSTDPDGVITYVNQRFVDISGYSAEELVGKTHRIIRSGQHESAFYEAMWRTIKAGEVWRGEILNRARDGRLYWVDATIVPMTDAEGRIQQFIAIRTEITDRKRWEAEMLEARSAAEAASRAKDEFLANMSHEIRTPMNGILGMTELLLETRLDGSQRDYLDAVRTSADSLLAIINDILDLSKIEAGKMTIEAIGFAPVELADSVIRLFSHETGRKGLKLTTTLADDLPVRLIGDPGRLRQVLLNLVGNAIKFTARGGVDVRMRWVRERAVLAIEVHDTGIGISPEKQGLIFEAFTQEDASITRKFGGTGLGLTISNKLIGLMGGELTVTSFPGQGSCFAFDLPLLIERGGQHAPLPATASPVAADPVGRDDPGCGKTPERDGGVAEEAAASERSLHILVAEDNPVNQLLMKALLTKWGHRLVLVGSGCEAVQACAGSRFDLVLMDIQMPDMGGLEATQRIRALEQATGHRTPIIALTAAAMASDRVAAAAAGLDAYLTKPLRQAELKAVLEEFGTPGLRPGSLSA